MRYASLPLLLLTLAGCSREKAPDATALPSPTPARVAQGELQHLSFLHGNWRGQAVGGGAPFYERYVALDDSTLQSYTFPDSTFSTPADSGQIRWINGQVRSGSGSVTWVATLWTPDSVRFDPEHGVRNSFIWIRQTPDSWQARLETSSTVPATVYDMTRLTR